MTLPTVNHVGLSVADLDHTTAFYSTALGLAEVVERVELPGAGVRTAMLQAPNGMRIELIERVDSMQQEFSDPMDGAGIQGFFHWALTVENLDATVEALLAAGASMVTPPADGARPGVRFAYLKDPEGNLLELIHEP
jgi:catechol 2,3-dioxygenase-like lactoylglutathione lyase family enzyme